MLVFSNPILLNKAPKCKRSDADNSYMPQRSRKVLPLSERVGVYKKKHSIYIGL